LEDRFMSPYEYGGNKLESLPRLWRTMKLEKDSTNRVGKVSRGETHDY